jgi:hypothetical protein
METAQKLSTQVESRLSMSTSIPFKCQSDKCNDGEPPVVLSSLSDTPDYLQYCFLLLYPGAVPIVF